MSDLNVTSISDLTGSGPAELVGQSAAKNWVNFNQTGTISIRESFNTTSITDNGTGLTTINYTNSFSVSDECVSLSSSTAIGRPNQMLNSITTTTHQIRIYRGDTNASADASIVCTTRHGDLA